MVFIIYVVCALTCHSNIGCPINRVIFLCSMYFTVVPPSLVPGSDIHQKSVIHYSVVGVSVLYLTPAVSAVVVPRVADNLATPVKSCHITGQQDSSSQSESTSFCKLVKIQFSSSTVSPDYMC